MLYLIDQNPDADVHWIRRNIESEIGDETLSGFAWQLFTAVRERQTDIDQRISSVAANWKIQRMAPTDRNIIRMGICEMEALETPAAVVLNECIELAKEFGTDNSPSFVNGILDRFSGTDKTSSAAD